MALAQCVAAAVAWRLTGAEVPAAGSPVTGQLRAKGACGCLLLGGSVQRVSSMCDGGHHAWEPVQDASLTSLCHLGTDLRRF